MTEVRQRRQQHADVHVPAPQHDDEKNNNTSQRKSRQHHVSIPQMLPLVVGFLLFYVGIMGTTLHFVTWLPEAMDRNAPVNTFSEGRTRDTLEQIMSFGYRPVGSIANDVLTPQYLLKEIEKIKAIATDNVRIEVDVQQPTGAFGLDFLTQFQNIYANVTNIVVRLSLSNVSDALDDSLMLSSHFDAAYGSAAASDDGVNVAIMMELLRLYATVPPQYGSLVFTFNGAEETIMQAAHGFITQHEWTKNIRAFINLEAAGAGGRALLFQTGSDELVRAYAEGAKYPYANIIAQEMFKTGVIPADTDFRVYRDFGEVAGMDFAYIYNGYVYHTALDDISRIQQGSIQHFGDNLVGVIQRLTSVPGRLRQVATSPRTSNTLFVDVLGIWMISTSKATAFTICGVVLLLSVVYLIQSPLHLSERTAGIKVVLQCMGSGVGASLVAGVVLTLFAPLTWYSSPLLVAVSFVPPALTGMLHRLITFLQSTKLKDSEVLWRIEEGLFEAMLCIWALGLVFLLGADLISSYVAAVWVIFPLVGQVLCHVLQSWNVLSSWSYSVISLLAALVPVLHSAMVLSIAFIFFVPLMGRCGPLVPPDLVMAVVVSLSLLVILSFTSRFFCFVPINKLVLLRNACFSISVVVVLLASTRNPFTDSTPKRLFVQHIHRQVLHDNGTLEHLDAGVWVTGLDYRGLGAIQPFLATTQWNQTTPVAPPKFLMDTNEVYGDLPFGLPVREFVPERLSWLLPSNPPVFQEGEPRATLKVISSHYDTTTDKRTIHLHFTGHSHLNIYIDSSTRLTSWSLGNGVDVPVASSDGTYILQFTTGLPPASFHFWIEAESNKPFDIAVVGHYLEKPTPELTEFVQVLPSWTDAVCLVSTWHSQTI